VERGTKEKPEPNQKDEIKASYKRGGKTKMSLLPSLQCSSCGICGDESDCGTFFSKYYI
jgi:hypothetical protein